MLELRQTVRYALFAVTVGTAPVNAQSSPPLKFAYVDTRVILDRAPGASDVQSQLEKERVANMARVQKMQDSLNVLVNAYQKDEPTLSDSQKVKRRDALESKRAEYEQRANDLDDSLQKHQADLVQPIMSQIREVLDKIRSEEGFVFIFDVGQSPVIVAADKNLDITERVIARLKPIPVNVSKSDSTKPPGTKPGPAGVKKPPPIP